MPGTVQRMSQGVLAGVMLAAGAGALPAQSCMGLPSLSLASRSASMVGAGTDQDRTLLARYGISGARAFGGLQAGYAGHEFKRPRSPLVGFDAGFVLPVGTSGKTQLCPILRSVYQSGPSGPAAKLSSITSSLGLSLGREIGVTQQFALVPFMQADVVHLHSSFAYTDVLGPNGTSLWGQRNKVISQFGVGLGLRFKNLLTVTPSYTMPQQQGAGIYQQRYSVSVSLGFKP